MKELKNTKVISVCNQKGGVGKTTGSACLCYSLAQKGYKVLAIDYDSQASLTQLLNYGLEEDAVYYSITSMMMYQMCDILDMMISQNINAADAQDLEDSLFEDYSLNNMDWNTLIEEAIVQPVYPERKMVSGEDGKKHLETVETPFGFDLLPSDLALAETETVIFASSILDSRYKGIFLGQIISRILEIKDYDFIIIDCNPSLGTLVTNALFAATSGALIPTNLDLMSTRGVRNMIQYVEYCKELIEERGGYHYGVLGILLNLFSGRRSVDVQLENDLNRYYPYRIFDAKIPESVDAKKAVFNGWLYSQMNSKARAEFDKLADEIVDVLVAAEEKEEEGDE